MTAIYKREMLSYFTSPIGYVFVAVFLALNAFIFSICTLMEGENSSVGSYFTMVMFIFIILVPLLTMKSFSEERRMRTEQLLLTSPVSLFGMVFAKFLAAFTMFGGTFIFGSLFNFAVLYKYCEKPNGAVLVSDSIGILLIGAAAAANRQTYIREKAVTPTPSITPRTVRITEAPGQPTLTPTPRLLQMNSVGLEVKELQERLRELGYYSGEVDGQYGGGTRSAVQAFQGQHGLDADGIAGESTLNLLYSANAQTFVPTPTPSDTPETAAMLGSGSQGDQVKKLQQRLAELGFYTGKVDGDYGKGTKQAVTVFQSQHGLDADGIAGEKTLRLLYSSAANLPMLVNKDHPIDADFVPADLVDMSKHCDSTLVKIKYKGTQGVREAVDALIEMLEAAKKDGVTNWQVSAAYRSVKDQQSIFDSNVKSYMNKNGLSREKAISATRKTVADPGTSEHHTGLAFDITVPGTSAFQGTKQCTWLHAHCWDYGFVVRYQKDKEDITGFLAEAWHIRYVGKEHSQVMREKNLCLEEYLDLAK